MYAYAYDKLAGAMVGVLSRPFNEEVDNLRLLESIAKHQMGAPSPTAVGLFVLAVDPQYPQPNAKWRRRFAEARDTVRFAKTYFAVVTPEMALRVVVTAVNWIRPPTGRVEAETFSTFDEAARWMEEKRGNAVKPLQKLLHEAQEKLGFGGESVPSVTSAKVKSMPASTEKASTERIPADRASTERIPADRPSSDKASTEKASPERASTEKASADKAPNK